jgi:hypothetical protein
MQNFAATFVLNFVGKMGGFDEVPDKVCDPDKKVVLGQT